MLVYQCRFFIGRISEKGFGRGTVSVAAPGKFMNTCKINIRIPGSCHVKRPGARQMKTGRGYDSYACASGYITAALFRLKGTPVKLAFTTIKNRRY